MHHNVPEGFLVDRGLTNYWGYNTIGFFAPHAGYSAAVRAGRPGGQVAEFQAMVDTLHGAGLEVILDVVFNHTAEGNHLGPTLCHRGLHNPAYYRLDPGDQRYYVDTTGTGNSLNADNPFSLRLIMDSLRYWLTEMRVDGFRFDLAPTLAREDGGFDRMAAFFDLVAQDPVVSTAKLIAEPWDVGQGDSYDLGQFPPQWSEWNGRYRDVMRDFWRSHDGLIGEFATRLCGSPDLYRWDRRRPTASINLITVHDGFTLADLVSYDAKHNEANGEDNRDGTNDNRSWNCGVEGPTTDPDILALRARQSRAMLTTLLLSFGVPMLLGGDELGRTQQREQQRLLPGQRDQLVRLVRDRRGADAFTKKLIALRRAHPVFRRRRFLDRRRGRRAALVHPGRHRDDRGGLELPRCPQRRALPGRRRQPRSRRGRYAARRRRLPAPGQRLVGTAGLRRTRRPSPARPGTWRSTPTTPTATPTDLAAGNHLTVRPRSIILLRGHRSPQGS